MVTANISYIVHEIASCIFFSYSTPKSQSFYNVEALNTQLEIRDIQGGHDGDDEKNTSKSQKRRVRRHYIVYVDRNDEWIQSCDTVQFIVRKLN